MPYIRPERREKLHPLSRDMAQNAGELNFRITKVVDDYLASRQGYGAYNEAIGALECAKLELYRRCIAPYEDDKCLSNGDVYS